LTKASVNTIISTRNICNLKNAERKNVGRDILNCVDGIKDKEAAKEV
jgi:hypothetical protein